MSTQRIAGPAGEIEIAVSGPDAPRAIAVICHPHPLAGGTMTNKVVTSTERALAELGIRCLRFNFRGVGHSAGTHDHGIGEQDDSRAVIDYLRAQNPGLPLVLAGFSFGAFVSAHLAVEVAPVQLLSIAPPVGRWDFSKFRHPHCAWSVLQPDADEVVSPAAVYDWVAHLDPAPRLHRFEGCSHFFHGQLNALRDVVQTHVQESAWWQ